jgi:hypothetical protein
MEIQNYLSNLTPTKATDYSLWKATKQTKSTQKLNPPIRIENSSWAKSNEEKAMVFAKHLEKVFQPHPSESNDDIYDFLNTLY